jgi:hypothetical protein
MTTPPKLLAVLLLCVPPSLEPVERPIPFASLTPKQAAPLEGKLRLFKVTLDSMGTEHGGRVGYDAQHDDEPKVMGSVYLSREVSDEVTTVYVRGVLCVIKHPRRGSRVSSAGLPNTASSGRSNATAAQPGGSAFGGCAGAWGAGGTAWSAATFHLDVPPDDITRENHGRQQHPRYGPVTGRITSP